MFCITPIATHFTKNAIVLQILQFNVFISNKKCVDEKLFCERYSCPMNDLTHDVTSTKQTETELQKNVNEIKPQYDAAFYQHNLFIYEHILQEIRDMRVLSYSQLNQLNNMSRRKLLYIISMYNMVIRNVNEVL